MLAPGLTAADVMTREVLSLKESMPILEAAALLVARGISGAPVVDGDGRLTGVLTEEDLLGVFHEGHRNIRAVPIGDCVVLGSSLVTRRVAHLAPDASLKDAARTMMTCKIKRMPVVDEQRRVIGIVSRRDILRAMVERRSAAP